MITLLSGKEKKLCWSRCRYGFILCLLLGLSACGQKGPLYLPESPREGKPANENRLGV
jgi:hypothetical protein